MPSLGKFNAWIEVNGQPLPEFESGVSADLTTVTCWVPSEAGKEFAVRWRDSNLKYTQRGNVFVDGQYCGAMVTIYPDRRGVVVSRVDAVSTGPFTTQVLAFPHIDSTEDDQSLQSSPRVENIGEIKLVVSEVLVMGSGTFRDEFTNLPDPTKVHGLTKKGRPRRKGYGIAQGKKPAPSEPTTAELTRTIVTFIFHYRPLAILQSTEIAPASVSQCNKRKASTPPAGPEPFEDENFEDEAALAAEIETLEAKLRELKERQNKRIKTEVKSEPLSSRHPLEKPSPSTSIKTEVKTESLSGRLPPPNPSLSPPIKTEVKTEPLSRLIPLQTPLLSRPIKTEIKTESLSSLLTS